MKQLLFAFLFLSLAMAHADADGNWMADLEDAMAKAKAENKPVLVNFTGSDWCGWCIRLDKEVFSKDAFKAFASDELVLVEVDFPQRKEQSAALKAQNERLLEKYQVSGFPTILLLSSGGEVIGKTGYQPGGAEVYIAHLRELLGELS